MSLVNLSELDNDVLTELCRARTDPQGFANSMEGFRKYYKGNRVYLPDKPILQTQEGISAFSEAVNYVKNQKSISRLEFCRGLTQSARDHLIDQSVSGRTGHNGSDGSSPSNRASRYGTWLITTGENLGN
eukprot:TRINITY_DN4406_c1_g2_i4.p1 TRINITY_DN4406_c1_g2~~TRINITY_DN4406_c1_g2_i4.p1  ORF type:complete len:130 (-),score=46.87 TRINITY_DN4406_c1_g2_i4:31-420(-)